MTLVQILRTKIPNDSPRNRILLRYLDTEFYKDKLDAQCYLLTRDIVNVYLPITNNYD